MNLTLSFPASGRLLGKYLLVVVPLFMVFTSFFLSMIAEHNANETQALLTARVGNKVATMATTLDYHHRSGNQRAAQDLIDILMADPAIECAELNSGRRTSKMLKAPQGLGCRGMEDYQALRIDIDSQKGSYLSLRYNVMEVEAARLAQRELSILAMLVGLIIAVATSYVGFRYIIHRPLRLLLTAIEESTADSRLVDVEQVPNDELGTVMNAYNEMQTQLKEAHDTLEAKVEERTQELVELQSKLLQQERLSTLGQVTATMSHEIRNPLGAIRNSLFVIREMADAADLKLTRPLDRAERSIARCDNIVGELLEYTRTQDVDLTVVDSCEYLNEVLDEQVFADSITLTRDLPTPGPQIMVDQDRFRRIIINLVDNAAQALRSRENEQGEINISCSQQDGGIVIQVSDNGPGMPDDVLTRIFEPLFTTKSFGAGLGLPTVQQLVEQHKGTLRVDTKVGVGTMFSISLPPAEARTSIVESLEQEKAA